MSKKSRRAKLIKRAQPSRVLKRSPQRASMPSQRHEQASHRLEYAREQMFMGDFAGCISTCEPLLTMLPGRSTLRLEVLSLVGMAHGMLEQYQQSYEMLCQAIEIDPTLAELWYNRGLACHFLARPAEAVLNVERAVALSENDPGEMARKFAAQLQEARQDLQEAMQSHGPDITFEQYLEREQRFTEALGLVRQERWQEAERLFRQLTETGSRIPSYWGNLGVCLLMQGRYDEAEAVLKEALAIDPDYRVARDNVKQLPHLRRSKQPIMHKLVNPYQEEARQSLALYQKDEQGEVGSPTVIERVGHAVTSTWGRPGKQRSRYNFFLNPYQNTRFTTCPQCQGKTRPRKVSLVVNVNPRYTIILDKLCRFCSVCDLLIVHQDQLEKHLATRFLSINPQAIGNDYQVLGTLEKAQWDQEKQGPLSLEEVREHLHDFQEVLTF